MKKFYIPTSTLNFNNILSSESISPKAFYEKRGFGYSRWTTVPENPFNNAIVLLENLCRFERPISDLEDHPLLIEVLLDETQLKHAEGFWYCDHTIYFAPTTTRFLFYTETDKTITLSMSEASLETKLMRLYARQIQTIQKPVDLYKTPPSDEPCSLNEFEIDRDVRINKMKGMLYGYYIGSLLSSDMNSVKYLNVLKEIHNIFAAILSSYEKHPTVYQNERLDALFDYLNEQNPDFKYLYGIINSQLIDAEEKAKTVWAWIIAQRGSFRNEDKSVCLSYLQNPLEKDNHENQAITWIKTKIENAKRQMQTKGVLLSPDKEEVVVVDNNLSVLKNSNLVDEKEISLCVSWLNETLSDKNTNGRISTYKEELAKNLTLKAKEVYQESWEGSPTRTYLNDLRRHIAGEEFKYGWNSGLLSSIAAVIVAGDDWEKLLAFMQNKEMTDNKLAFAFYGTLNGFANLTRDFTDILYNKDKNYVWAVYKEFYGQLFGETLSEIREEEINSTKNILPNLSNETQAELNTRIVTILQSILGHPKYNEKKHKQYIEQIKKKGLTNWNEIRLLSSKSDGWKRLIDELKKKENNQKVILPTLDIKREIGKFFYCDDAVWDYIEERIPDSSKKKIKEDLDWFQKELQKPKSERKFYKDIEPTNNRIAIEKFCSLKQNFPYFTDNLRKELKDLLFALYKTL